MNPFHSGYGKQDLLQTVKTLMKYCIRWYFRRICTVALFIKIKTIFRWGCGLVLIRLWGLPFIFGIWHKGFFGYMHRSRSASYLILNLWLFFLSKSLFYILGAQKNRLIGKFFWVCTVWTRTRSSLISACSVCLHIFGNHAFILEQAQ